ncbi:MAG TPA: cytochrome P450 [Kofleriaceae bacterium]|nr:cytochrome P450 [Kofleriaceae bacterium]
MTATYDLQSAEFYADPYPTYARMRRDDPLYWYADMNMFMLTRYADVQALSASRHSSVERVDAFFMNVSDPGSKKVAVVREFLNKWMVFMDSPAHARMRKLVAKTFSPRNIRALEPLVHRVTDEILDQVAPRSGFDVVNDVGFPIPARVISHMLGVSQADIHLFQSWTQAVFRVPAWVGDPDENIAAAYDGVLHLEEYFHGLIVQRRSSPTEDLLSLLVNAEEDGQFLSEQELVSTCALILVAGHETTAKFIGNAILALLRNPDQMDLLRSRPELIESAVEELLRFETVSGGIVRLAKEDIELPSGRLPAGSLAFGAPQSANRDEAVFPDPDRLDITRSDIRHLTFGHGPHTCLGAALGRLEGRIILSEILRRFPQMRLATDELTFAPSMAIRGLTALPICHEASPAVGFEAA